MAGITAAQIQELRTMTGVGMMDCKKALVETGGDIQAAVDLLRKKGAKVAAKRAGQDTNNGIVHAYIHPGGQVGVMVKISCETDFSANSEPVKEFVHNLCMHIAAANPLAVDESGVDGSLIEKEKEIYREQLEQEGKPAQVIEKIIEGKVRKYYSTICLLKQPYIKNDKINVGEYLNELIAKVGENVKVAKFSRFQIGN